MSTLYAFLQKGPESAEIIAKTAGTKLVEKETHAYERQFFIKMPMGKSSVREVEEIHIHPNTIKSLPVGHCVGVKKYPRAISYRMKVKSPE